MAIITPSGSQAVLLQPRFGVYLVAAWLTGIIVTRS